MGNYLPSSAAERQEMLASLGCERIDDLYCQVPEEMKSHIRRMEVILGQATMPRVHCASISYGDEMEITFAGTQRETDTEREFFRFLVRDGVHVKVESNRTQ